nr:MAG TPA: hypothetical protein [Caudoviricetes sp.]
MGSIGIICKCSRSRPIWTGCRFVSITISRPRKWSLCALRSLRFVLFRLINTPGRG